MAHPHLRVILQDQQQVIEGEAKAFWAKEDPAAVDEGRVTLMAHDFLGPQPVKDATVFLMRVVIHDWDDAKATVILKNLGKASTAETKLILVEQLIQPLCPVDQLTNVDVPGRGKDEMPAMRAPLLSTAPAVMSYLLDLVRLFCPFDSAINSDNWADS